MKNDLIATTSVTIDTPVAKVWAALVNPAAIEQYLFGAKVVTNWREGSAVIWQREWQGKMYEDKGMILQLKPEQLLQCTHFSPLSGLPDEPQNYHTLTIALAEQGSQTRVSLTQDKNATEEARQHSGKNWGLMLASMKQYLEQ